MPHASETAMVNAATRRSRPGVTKLGNVTGLCAMQRATATRASTSPTAAPSIVSTQLSVISWRSSRPRPAPSAVRTAISRRRASDRAISRLATLAQAMSRTNATAAISVSSAGRSAPNSSTSSGLTSTAAFLVGVRVRLFEPPRDARRGRFARAARVTPGLSRASAANPRDAAFRHRARRRIHARTAPTAPPCRVRPLKPGGITPTTVYCRARSTASSCARRSCGSAPNRRFQKPSLRTTTCAGVATTSSLGLEHAAAGGRRRRAARSTAPPRTRSGCAPVRRCRRASSYCDVERRDVLEALRLRAPVEVIGIRGAAPLDPRALHVAPQLDQSRRDP